jgi:branched-chain amino acid transport system permease protein
MNLSINTRGLLASVAAVIATALTFELLLLVLPSGIVGFLTVGAAYVVGVLVGGSISPGHRQLTSVAPLLPLALLAPRAVDASDLTQILLLGVVALGLNILTGWAGQLNLAQGIFVGLGAYTTAILGTDHQWPLLLTLPAAGLVVAAFGAILGVVALRFADVYLAVLTTAVALTAPVLLKHYSGLTHGTLGISVTPLTVPSSLQSSISVFTYNYVIALVIAAIAVVTSWRLLSGRVGRALLALRDSEHAAQGVGINVTRFKVLAFILSAFWAGVAGGLYAITIGYIAPDSFGLFYGIQFIIMIVVGGTSSIPGSFVGAAFVYALSTHVQEINIPGHVGGQNFDIPQQAVFAVVLILVAIAAPRGIAGLITNLRRASRLHRLPLLGRAFGSHEQGLQAAGGQPRYPEPVPGEQPPIRVRT